MIEINLIPDVKLELIKSQRARAKVVTFSIIIGIISIAAVAFLAFYVYGVQNIRSALYDKTIDEEFSKLASVEDLDKALTIQNQLSKISQLHDNKNMYSRFFNVLIAIIPPSPNDIKISSLEVDSGTKTISIDGQASNGYAALEIFKKTIAGANIKYEDSEGNKQEAPLASEISTKDVSYGEDSDGGKVLRFTISFVYDDSLFSPKSKNMSVFIGTKGNVTDSYVGIPKSIFTDPAADLNEEEK